MRIPRLAFVVLIAGVVALASSLAVVKVRAHADGTVVLLSISAETEKQIECALSTVNKKFQRCGFIGNVGGNVLGYKIQLLSRSDSRVQLGVRAGQWPASPGTSTTYGLDDIDSHPEQQFWFEPGDTLKIDNPGLPTVAVKGTWLDHMPSFVGTNEMDPGPDELRIISPLLLQGTEVAQTDMMEANLGQLAATQAAAEGVKDYAEMLVTDHTNDYTQLSMVASKANLEIPKGLDAAHDKMIAPFKKLKGVAFDHRYIQEVIAGHTKGYIRKQPQMYKALI